MVAQPYSVQQIEILIYHRFLFAKSGVLQEMIGTGQINWDLWGGGLETTHGFSPAYWAEESEGLLQLARLLEELERFLT